MTLSANRVVRVTAQILPQGLRRKEFGKTLHIYRTQDNANGGGIPVEEVVRTYPDMRAIQDDFKAGDSVYDAAQTYFSQKPFPKNFMAAPIITVATNPILIAEQGMRDGYGLTEFQNLCNGGDEAVLVIPYYSSTTGEEVFYFSATWIPTDFTSMDEFAALLTSKLATAGFPGAGDPVDRGVFVYDADNNRMNFELELNDPLEYVVIHPFHEPEPVPGVQNLAPAFNLNMGAEPDPLFVQAIPADVSIGDVLDRVEVKDPSFYFITLSEFLGDSYIAETAAWTEARTYMYPAGSTNPECIVGGDSEFKTLHSKQMERTIGIWSGLPDNKAVSLAARFSSVNFNAKNSLITLMLKRLPTTVPDNLTATQVGHLEAENINCYVELSGAPSVLEGWTFSDGTWSDVRYWLDWLVNAVQVATFNALYVNPTKVPQTTEGQAMIRGVIENVCRQGVDNGGLAPGQLSPQLTLDVQQSTGNADFDGFLTKGFLVYCAPMSTLPQSERNQRKIPPFKVWLKGSGAVHSIDIGMIFEN